MRVNRLFVVIALIGVAFLFQGPAGAKGLCPIVTVDDPIGDKMGNVPAGAVSPKASFANAPANSTLTVTIWDITGRARPVYGHSKTVTGSGTETFNAFTLVSGTTYKVVASLSGGAFAESIFTVP